MKVWSAMRDQALRVIVQPRATRASYAVTALAVQVAATALVPPWRLRLPLLVPAVLIETIMFSMEAAVRAQPVKASR